eukprot:scaffold5686_cov171-Ochromonas_danica.AAC.1
MAIQQIPIGGSDRTGRTIFDIVESIPRSALSSVRGLLLEATGAIAMRRSGNGSGSSSSRSTAWEDAVSPPLSSNIMTASSTAAGGGSGPYHHHHPHHRVSSAVVASS